MNELAVRNGPVITTMDDLARVSKMFAESGLFRSAKDAAQAGVQILAGVESGFGAFASMAGIHIIEGKPTMGANLMALAIKRSGKYNYKVNEHTDSKCTIEIFERWDGKWESAGVSTFDMEDAKAAGARFKDRSGAPTPWAKYPRNMLFARAISNAVRWYCPDALSLTAYVPEELGADVDADGEVIDAEVRLASEPVQEPKQEPVKAKVEDDKTEAPKPKTITPERAEALKVQLTKLGYDVSNEAQLLEDAFGLSDLEHLTELTDGEAVILWKRLQQKAKEAAKEPWERWQKDGDAIDYGAQAKVFGTGQELMTLWEEMKHMTFDPEVLPGGMFQAWFNEINRRAEIAKAA